VEVVASLSQGRTAAAQCGLFTYKSVPVIFESPCKKGRTQNRPSSVLSIKRLSVTTLAVITDRQQFVHKTHKIQIRLVYFLRRGFMLLLVWT